jgi:hypothetical protein
MRASEAISDDWKSLLVPKCPIAFGLDPATTENQTSNPTGFACVQKVGLDYIVRLLARWKTADPEVARIILRQAMLNLPHGLRPRRLVIDASNEKYFATDLKTEFRKNCQVELVTSTQNITYLGQTMPMKVYLGNLPLNALEDGHLLLPEEEWIAKDWRLVKRDRGSFTTEVDTYGAHGDTFDGVKNALHGLITRSGPAEAHAAPVGLTPTGSRQFYEWPPKRPNRRENRLTLSPRLCS